MRRPALAVSVALLAVVCPSASSAAVGDLSEKSGQARCTTDDGAGGQCKDGHAIGHANSVVSPDGKHLYSANFEEHTVTVFNRDTSTGELTQKAGINGCIAGVAVAGCDFATALIKPLGVAVSSDGKHVYVSSYDRIAVLIFDRDPDTGVLTQKAGQAGCVAEDAAGATGGVCEDGHDFGRPDKVVLSADGKNVYASMGTDGGNGVVIFDRDTTTGELEQKAGPAGCLSNWPGKPCTPLHDIGVVVEGLAISPDDRSLYTTSRGSVVGVIDRNPVNGELTQKAGPAGCISESGSGGNCQNGRGLMMGSPAIKSPVVSPDGKNVYSPASDSDAVAIFDRDTSGGASHGALAQKDGEAGCISNTGSSGECKDGRGLMAAGFVAASPDGRSIYVGTFYPSVALFDRDPATGTLTQKPGNSGCITSGSDAECRTVFGSGTVGAAVTLSGNGRNLYTGTGTGPTDDGILTLDRETVPAPPPPPPPDAPPPSPPAPPAPATTHDLSGRWVLLTKESRGASYVMFEDYTSMDKGSGEYSGTGRGGKYTWGTSGVATGNRVRFVTGPYNEQTSYTAAFNGVIGDDGSISGTWVDSNGNRGTFSQYRSDAEPPPPGDFPSGTEYMGNWALDTYDESGLIRYSRSALTLSGLRGPPIPAFLGFGTNPPHSFAAELLVGGTEVRMGLSGFSHDPKYAPVYRGERIGPSSIAGVWNDESEQGQWTMTRSTTPASTSGSLVPSLRGTAPGGAVVEITPPVSCRLSASSAGVFSRASVGAAATKKGKKLGGIRVPRFGPVFVSAGERVRIPVRPVAQAKRTKRAAVRVAATRRTTVRMKVVCTPARGPSDPDPPPVGPSDPISTTVDVPANVTTPSKPEPKRLKPGLWIGTPIGGGAGGVTFSVSSSGAVIDENGGQPLTVRAPQQCGSPQGLTASGLGKVTLLRSIKPSPASSYPREARYLKQNITANGGGGGLVNLVLSFTGDDSGTATLSASQPARPLAFSCRIPMQSYVLRHAGNATPAVPVDGLPYETGEGATQAGPLRGTTTTLTCNRGPQPTSDANCIATVIDSDAGVRTLPGGTVRWTLERGSFPNGDTCTLTPHPKSTSMSQCSVVYRPDAAGIPAATRIPVSVEYEGSSQHASSKATAEGKDPLVFVCSGLWTAACEGKVPKPQPVETCVAAWQQCEGFRGSKNTGTIDISSLPDKSPQAGEWRPPKAVNAPVECDEEDEQPGAEGGGQRKADIRPAQTEEELKCIINSSVNGTGSEADAAALEVTYRNNLRVVRTEVDSLRSETAIGLLKKLAENLQRNSTDEHTQRVVAAFTLAMTNLVDGIYDRFQKPGGPRNWPRDAIAGEAHCERNFSGDPSARSTCVDLIDRINAKLYEDAKVILALQRRLKVDTPLKKSSISRSSRGGLSASARRRTPFVFASGSTTVSAGADGKLTLSFSPEARQLLEKLRRRGVRSIKTTVTTTTSRAGIRTTSSQPLRLKLR